jgi:uncharacterized protein YfaQ (DUF2300 family)
VKRLLIICMALAVYACLEAAAQAEYDLRSVDWYRQEKPSAQANDTRGADYSGVKAKDFPPSDADRVNVQAGGSDDNDGDDGEGDDNGDENGKEGGSNRMWDVAEFG